MLKAGSTNMALSSRLFALWTSLPTLTYQSKSLQYCLFHASQLQYLLILFWIQTYFTLSDDKEALTHWVVEATKVCNLRDMLIEADKNWLYSFLLIFMWVYLLGLAAAFTLFRAPDKTANHPKPSIRSTVIQFILQIHFSVIFWLINMVISASWSGSNPHRNLIFARKVPQAVIILINCFALVLNYLIAGISALFCFYPFKNQNILGSYSSSSQFTTFLCKAVLTPFIMTYQDDNMGIQAVLAVVVLVFSAIKLVQSMRSIEYYSYSMSKAILTWNIAGVWISLTNAFFLILTDNLAEKKVKALFYISVVLLPIVIKFKVQDFEKRIDYYLSVDVSRLKSQQEILKKIQALDMLGENMKKGILKSAFADRPEIYFLGELSEHKKQCQEPDCLCSFVADPESKAPVNSRELVERYLYKRTLGILNEAAGRIQPNHDLKIAIANIIINNEEKLATLALAHLGGIIEENADIFTKINKRLLLNLLQEKVDIHFKDSENNSLNVRKLLDFQTDKTCFVDHLIKNTNNYIEFWTYFKHLRLQLASLVQKSSKIDQVAERIDHLWERFGNRYPEFQNLLYEPYAIYLRLISNMPNRATKVMKQFAFKSMAFRYKTKLMKTINQENMYLSDTITVYVSMARGRLGNIQHITPNIQGILGYTQKELTNQNISCFFTPLFAHQHFQILEKHLEEKRTFRGNNHLHTKGYIRTKGGFIKPCFIYVTISPYLQGELTYIAAIRTFENDYEQINFSTTGLVDSYTFGISQELNLSTNHQQPIKITDICPDMEPAVRRKSRKFKWSTIIHSVNDKLSFKKSIQTNETGISPSKESPITPDNTESPYQDDVLLEETDWQNIDFLQLNPSYEGAKKTFQVKVVKQDYMKKKFFAMLIKPNAGRGDGSAPIVEEFREIAKAKEFTDRNDSEVFEIPEETYTLQQTINPLSPRGSISPLLTQTPRMFARPPALNFFDFNNVNSNNNSRLLSENQSPTIQDSNLLQGYSFLQSRNDASSPRLHLLVKRQPEVVVKKNLKLEAVKEVEPKRDSELSHFEEDENLKMKLKDDFGTTSLASSKHAKSKIEFATYAVPSNPVLRALRYITYTFLLLCIAFIVSFILKEQSNLQVVKGNVDILRYCNIRLTRLIGIKRGVNYFPMYQQGIITEKRYLIYGVPNFLTNTITATLTAEKELSSANNLLRSALNQTQPDLQKNFFNTLVPLKLNSTGALLPDYLYRNTFDAVIEIMVRAIKISTMKLEEFKNTIDEVTFIFENGFNDILVTSELINTLMVQDSDSRFHEMNKLNLAELLSVVAIGILLLGCLARRQLDAIKGRNRIIDMFLRIEDKQVDQTLSEVKFFQTNLGLFNCQVDVFGDNNATTHNKSNNNRNQTEQGSRIRRRDAETRGLNNRQFMVFGLGILLFTICLTPFLTLTLLTQSKTDMLRRQINTIIQINNGLYETFLLFTSFYDYVITKGEATLRSNPIGEEWETLYSKRAQGQEVYSKLLITIEASDDYDQDTKTLARSLIAGNICALRPDLAASCPSLLDPLLGKGIQMLNSYILYAIRAGKTEFDKTDMGLAAQKKVLGKFELLQIEVTVRPWLFYAYDTLEEIFEDWTIHTIGKVEDQLRKVAIMFIVITFFGVMITAHYLMRIFENDRIHWRKILRRIPIESINNSKMLQMYLQIEATSIIQNQVD